MEMEGKRYSLRSGSCRQTKLEFPCRRGGWRSEAAGPGKKTTKKKREQAPLLLEPADCADENESPPKRSRVSEKETATAGTVSMPATPTKSPLKPANQIGSGGQVTRSHDPCSSPGTPPTGANGLKTPPTNQNARKRLLFSPSAAPGDGSGGAAPGDGSDGSDGGDCGGGDFGVTLTPLQKTKRSLHNSLPSTLLCRDGQQAELAQWLGDRVSSREGGALYISGAPGTGKTACVTHLLQQMKSSLSGVKVLAVNCMSVTSPQALYLHLATSLQLQQSAGRGKKKETARERVLRHITTSKKLLLVVLDEMDQLDCRNQEVLYSLFEWSSLPHSRLILIGIANALDLTDRLLPRLTSHAHCKPHLLHFPPYTREQISAILRARVGGGTEVVVDPAAIEFCARKVSSVHGDLRKALDICRRAIELVESQNSCSTDDPLPSQQPPHTTPQPLTTPHSHQPHTTPCSHKPRKLTQISTENQAPLRVKLSHIASVVSSVYTTSTSSLLSHSTSHTLPLQQKLVVATLLLCVRGKSVKEVAMGKLQDMYGRVCGQWQVKSEGGQSEFVGLCQVLESRGLVAVKRAKEMRMNKVALKLQESEVEHVLQDQPLLSTLLKQNNIA